MTFVYKTYFLTVWYVLRETFFRHLFANILYVVYNAYLVTTWIGAGISCMIAPECIISKLHSLNGIIVCILPGVKSNHVYMSANVSLFPRALNIVLRKTPHSTLCSININHHQLHNYIGCPRSQFFNTDTEILNWDIYTDVQSMVRNPVNYKYENNAVTSSIHQPMHTIKLQ